MKAVMRKVKAKNYVVMWHAEW